MAAIYSYNFLINITPKINYSYFESLSICNLLSSNKLLHFVHIFILIHDPPGSYSYPMNSQRFTPFWH